MRCLIDKLVFFLKEPRAIYGLCLWPTFSFASYRIIKRIKAEKIWIDTLIDVGANHGQFTVAANELFPLKRVYSFEPIANVYKKLCRNTSRYKNVVVENCALGHRAASAEFYINTHSHSSSFLKLSENHIEAFPDARTLSTVNVDIARLDEKIESDDLLGTVLLKIDVQGYEKRVLEGTKKLLPNIRYVLLEVSFTELYRGEVVFDELNEYMRKAGFALLRPMDWLEDPVTTKILQADMLYERVER